MPNSGVIESMDFDQKPEPLQDHSFDNLLLFREYVFQKAVQLIAVKEQLLGKKGLLQQQ